MARFLDTNFIHDQAKALKAFLEERVINQDRAISAMTQSFNFSLSPIARKDKPIFVGVFLGPSGVGKTMLARKLAEFLFDDENALTTVEGQLITQPHELSELIGSPPGYVGYDTASLLSQYKIDRPAIRKILKSLPKDHPLRKINKELRVLERAARGRKAKASDQIELYRIGAEIMAKKEEARDALKKILKDHTLYSVLLVDEIEKADRSLANFLLGIMERGKIQLKNGSTTSFRNTFLIITGNIGSDDIANYLANVHIGFTNPRIPSTQDQDKQIYTIAMEKARKQFAAAFLGRIDALVVFRPHAPEDFKKIFDLAVQDMMCGYADKDFPIRLLVSEAAREFIIARSTDHPEEGARLLGKKLDHYLAQPLANILASGQVQRNAVIAVDFEDGRAVFHAEDDAQ